MEIDEMAENIKNGKQIMYISELNNQDYENLKKYAEVKNKLKKDENAADVAKIVEQLDIFEKENLKNSVDYVTLTLSGNDIGFSEIVEGAVKERLSSITDKIDRNPQKMDKLDTVMDVNKLTQVLDSKLMLFDFKVKYYLYAAYTAIQDKAGKQAKIIVAGYPKLLNENGSVLFSAQASQQVNKYASIFNKKIEEIVNDCRKYGGLNIYFVSVEGYDYFGGHEAGTKEPYINYIKLFQSQDLDESKFASDYSIHPNEKGVEVYKAAVQEKINELEDNGMLSGFIYENCENVPIKDISSKINTTFQVF